MSWHSSCTMANSRVTVVSFITPLVSFTCGETAMTLPGGATLCAPGDQRLDKSITCVSSAVDTEHSAARGSKRAVMKRFCLLIEKGSHSSTLQLHCCNTSQMIRAARE